MDKDSKQALAVVVTVLGVTLIIAAAILLNNRMFIEGGYSEDTIPGHQGKVWVKKEPTK